MQELLENFNSWPTEEDTGSVVEIDIRSSESLISNPFTTPHSGCAVRLIRSRNPPRTEGGRVITLPPSLLKNLRLKQKGCKIYINKTLNQRNVKTKEIGRESGESKSKGIG